MYVFTEPASNMPSRSFTPSVSAMISNRDGRTRSRMAPELMFGINENWMAHVGATFADMHTTGYAWESVNAYVKYRFLSNDQVHRHFRMALFANGSHSRNQFHYDEISLMGDKPGIQAGIIATQLWKKLAVSGTLAHTQVFHKSRKDDVIYVPERNYRSIDYSLSAGYLVLPVEYKDYKQTNLNLYLEFLGQQTIDRSTNYIDIAPALQLIFNSNLKVNIGRRFQIAGNMERMNDNSWLITVERTLLNAF